MNFLLVAQLADMYNNNPLDPPNFKVFYMSFKYFIFHLHYSTVFTETNSCFDLHCTSMKRKNTNDNRFLSLIAFHCFLLVIDHLTVSISAKTVLVQKNKDAFGCISYTKSAPPSYFQALDPNKNSESKLSLPMLPKSNIDPDPIYSSPFVSPCIFTTQYTQTFQVSAGHKFIRLHFYPTSVPHFNISNAIFSVTSDPYTLLETTESSYLNDASGVDDYSLISEFIVNADGGILNLTFTPSSDSSDKFGFVNMVEIISMSPNLYIQGPDVPIRIVNNPLSPYVLNNSTELEMMYRLNVGRDAVSAEFDYGNMSRVWCEDGAYLTTNAARTVILQSEVTISSYQVATTKIFADTRTLSSDNADKYTKMTWLLPVNPGFYYLIRLHFCEIAKHVKRGDRVFHIYINSHTAEDRADVMRWSNRSGVPVSRDYIVNLTRNSHGTGIQNLWLTLQRNPESGTNYHPVLSGLEIFKISNTRNSFVPPPYQNAPPPTPNPQNPPPPQKPGRKPSENHGIRSIKQMITTGFLIGILATPFVYAFLLQVPKIYRHSCLVLIRRRRNNQKTSSMKLESSEQCRCFSFSEIKSATSNFSDALLIGSGGYGKVYMGYINGKSATKVAIKRGCSTSHQGSHEFQTEIATLSRLRHCHLVSLIGYCMDNGEMILVYDLMARGNLRDHLYSNNNKIDDPDHRPPPLPWEQRLKICIGAARGLHYLHTGMEQTIIHRDVKTTNILLDEEWMAKVSDFGLSRLGPNAMNQFNDIDITTVVKGSFGYLDPEYYRRQKLTEKSDVYSFGVVLFEVLCARPAMIPTVEEKEAENYEQVNLAEWVLYCDQIGTVHEIIDPFLKGKIDSECLKTFTDVAKKCLGSRGSERPTMGDVLWNLELAWHQQIGRTAEGERMVGETSKTNPSSTSNICCDHQLFVICDSKIVSPIRP